MKMRKVISKLYNMLPVPFRVLCDSRFNPPPHLNRQNGREKIVRDIFQSISFDAVIETGSFRGGTTEFFAKLSHSPVYTVELNPVYHKYVKLRLSGIRDLHLAQGDSREFLRNLAREISTTRKLPFFYLDAHWWEDLPLLEEILIIYSAWEQFVILIDDFRVPGDSGYGYDNYGLGKVLEIENLPELNGMGLSCFFPSLPSACETGLRRGCVVFSDIATGEKLKQVPTLNEFDLNRLVYLK